MIQRLSDLIPPGIFVGAGLILAQEGRLLYGVRSPRVKGERQVLELTGVGGALEPGDVSISAGVQREAMEEIGCPVHFFPCQETLVIHGPGKIERLQVTGPEQPIALVFRGHRTPPHQPWHAQNQGKGCLVVFQAELAGDPWPAGELPWLVWLQPEHVVKTAQEDLPFRELLLSGAELILGEAGPPPASAWAQLTDSQEALVLALGEGALSFYKGLTAPRD